MRLSSFLELIQLLLNRGLFFLRGSRKFFFQALLKLCQSLARCWVNSNGCIAQHCFGTRGCDCDRFGLTWLGVDYRVTEMPEVSFDDFMKDFIIADGCLQEGVPVDESFAAENQSFLEQIEERGANCLGTRLVQRKTRPRPVARTSHRS